MQMKNNNKVTAHPHTHTNSQNQSIKSDSQIETVTETHTLSVRDRATHIDTSIDTKPVTYTQKSRQIHIPAKNIQTNTQN